MNGSSLFIQYLYLYPNTGQRLIYNKQPFLSTVIGFFCTPIASVEYEILLRGEETCEVRVRERMFQSFNALVSERIY